MFVIKNFDFTLSRYHCILKTWFLIWLEIRMKLERKSYHDQTKSNHVVRFGGGVAHPDTGGVNYAAELPSTDSTIASGNYETSGYISANKHTLTGEGNDTVVTITNGKDNNINKLTGPAVLRTDNGKADLTIKNLGTLNIVSNTNASVEDAISAWNGGDITIQDVDTINIGTENEAFQGKANVDDVQGINTNKARVTLDVGDLNINVYGKKDDGTAIGTAIMAQKNGSGDSAYSVDVYAKRNIFLKSNSYAVTVGALESSAGNSVASLVADKKVQITSTESTAISVYKQPWDSSKPALGDARLIIKGTQGVSVSGQRYALNAADFTADDGNVGFDIESDEGNVNLTAKTQNAISMGSNMSKAVDGMIKGKNVSLKTDDAKMYSARVIGTKTTLTVRADNQIDLNHGFRVIKGASLNFDSRQNGNKATVTLNDKDNVSSTVDSGTVTFGKDTVTYIDGTQRDKDEGHGALIDVKNGGKVEAGDATLYVDNAKKGELYKVLSDGNGSTFWDKTLIKTNNVFLKAQVKDNKDVVILDKTNTAGEIFGDPTVIPNDVFEAGKDDDLTSDNPLRDFVNTVAQNDSTTKGEKVAAINSAASIAELGGAAHGTYAAGGLFADAIARHDLSEDKNVWAYGFHNKENVDGLGLAGTSANYDGQLNGVVAGVDLYQKDGKAAGIAFAYGDGNFSGSNGVAYTKNDATYKGIALYGRADRGNYKLSGDIFYLSGDNDITQKNNGTTITAKPDTEAWSAGVKAAKGYAAGETGTLTAYAGARYLRLSTDSYTSSLGLHYDGEDQNLFLLPVGVDYSAAIDHGAWKVRPYVGVGYVWTLGDRSADQTVSYGAAADTITFNTADAGSFVVKAGVTTDSDTASYGIGYTWQKGSSTSNNTWTVSASYKF